MTPIAIVGMGCRFGGCPDLHAYWDLTTAGRDAFGPVPADRWPHELFYSESRRATDKSYAPHGSFIDDVQAFPALHLGIPPRRVEVMDPQQRLAIEFGLRAIHDAGYTPDEMPRRTGVYMGVTANEFRQTLSSRVTAAMMAAGMLGDVDDDTAAVVAKAVSRVVPPRPYSAPGALVNMVAAAVAQELDLHGPAYTLDAACASALMAVNDAVAMLRAGQIDAALAGGVYLQLSPENYVAFSRIGAMSASGYCRPFDTRADGFVQGDGCGVVVLKRLDDAQRDGDRIYAVLHGIAINNDGRGDGPMAPVLGGQVEAIELAWKDSGMDPDLLGYVETHGTGTDVGDRTELTGLRRALPTAHGVALGSSKANVGHTMSAAGIAGLIRASLAIHHAQLPPMAGFKSAKDELQLHPQDAPNGGWFVPTVVRPWVGRERVAAVSSFGFGGTNGHLVLGEAPATDTAPSEARLELLPLSSPDEATMAATAARLAAVVRRDALDLPEVVRGWSHRPGLPHRVALVVADRDDLLAQLDELAEGTLPAGAAVGDVEGPAPRVAFLFPGQGAQRVGMLKSAAARFPVLRERLAAFDAAAADVVGTPITELLWPAEGSTEATEARLTYTAHTQPALVAVGLALAGLLDDLGITPVVATGHSLGEFCAAAAAGCMSPEAAVRFAAHRGAAMAAVQGDPGAMVALRTDIAGAEALLVDGAVVANVNHPDQTVVSGTSGAVAEVTRRAASAGLDPKSLPVSHAFHSPLFASLDLEDALAELQLSDPSTVVVASGIAERPWQSAEDGRAILRRHAASAVRFDRALQQVADADVDLYLQVGAGGPLASFARKGPGSDARAVLTLSGMNDDDGGEALLRTLGWLWVHGVPLDTKALAPRVVPASLPDQVLPVEHYWPVKTKTQKALHVASAADAAASSTGAQGTEGQPQTPPAAERGSGDETFDGVAAVVAKVSSYPRKSIHPTLSLVDDLGFDSLMVADLATGLGEAFPGMGGLPQELMLNRPTVQDLVDHVTHAGQGTVIDDDAPLLGYTPIWVDAPDEPMADAPCSVHFAGPGAAAVATEGLSVVAAEAAEAFVWVADASEPVPLHAAIAGEASVTDRSGALIEALDALARAGHQPHVLVVHRDDDPWAEAEAAVARCVAREWTGKVGRSVAIAPGTPLAHAITLELRLVAGDMDHSPAVRWSGATRQLRGFEAVGANPSWTPGEADTVLVTGGTRGIGAQLAARLAAMGARVLLVGRSAPSADVAELGVHLQVDVTDREALLAAAAPYGPITGVVHAAGVLADGALGEADPERGAMARRVKVEGWLNALATAAGHLKGAVAIGSWAGRFGNRHQAHYAAGNALCAALTPEGAVVSEFGPWTESEMVRTIPPAVQAAMRAEGIDFVGNEAGMAALLEDLTSGTGVRTRGRALPFCDRVAARTRILSVASDPFLADHAIEGTPVLPLAAAVDMMASLVDPGVPFEVRDVTLFQGVSLSPADATETLHLSVRGERAEIRKGPRRTLCYRATVRPLTDVPELPTPLTGGTPSETSLEAFYDTITFHGPLLAGVTCIDGVAAEFVRGRVRAGRPTDWTPDTHAERFTVDPLALDSAMQLAALVAWDRYRRAGTPVALHRWVQLRPMPEGELTVEARFAPPADGEDATDRFEADFVFRDQEGTPVALAFGAVAELRAVEGVEEPLVIDPAWVDPTKWKEVFDLDQRLEAAKLMGIRNPYFQVHEGIARDTTVVQGREMLHFSSYNYLGYSGDPRVTEVVCEAVTAYGTSVSASRVASGERPFHHELERELADAQQLDDSLVFSAGHMTNVNVVGHVMQPGDLILHDAFAHDSLLQGAKLSGAGRRSFRHEDPDHLEQLLKELRGSHKKVMILIEGVYSMDGDICQLPRYVEIKKKYGCLLMVDEAHSFGVVGKTGRGVGEYWQDLEGLVPSDVDLWMGTLSKSLSSCGGWIAGSAAMIRYLRYTAPGFVFSAGITPANATAALTSLRLMLAEPERVEKLQANARFFVDELQARGIDTGPALGGSAVVPTITGNSMHALMLSERLQDQGINVQPIVYPAVADDAARLRFFLSYTHSREQLLHTAIAVSDTLGKLRREFPV